MFGTTKHFFELYSPGKPDAEQVKQCIAVCTADGSEVVKIKTSYRWWGGYGMRVTVWTKKKK